MGHAGRALAHALGQPGLHRILDGKENGSGEDEPRDKAAEELLARVQEQEAADGPANQSSGDEVPETLLLALDVLGLRNGATDVAGKQRDGIGNVGSYGRYTNKDEGWEGDERAATGEGVDSARGNRGERNKKQVNWGEQGGKRSFVMRV